MNTKSMATISLMFALLMVQFASAQVPDCKCCHTWHNITAGEWSVTVSSTHEESHFWNATSCKEFGRNGVENVVFDLSKKETITYGFAFPEGGKNGDDFDVVYTITAIKTAREGEEAVPVPAKLDAESSRKLLIASTGCIYVVSAASAAQPDIRANVYNGALCMWSRVPGIGENFLIDYAL